MLPGPVLQPAKVKARASSKIVDTFPDRRGEPNVRTGYGARFILHLGEASDGTLTLFQMGYVPF